MQSVRAHYFWRYWDAFSWEQQIYLVLANLLVTIRKAYRVPFENAVIIEKINITDVCGKFLKMLFEQEEAVYI